MKAVNLKWTVLVVFLVATAADLAPAQDWPQWRGPNRDAKVAGFAIPETWPESFTQKWKITVGAGDATPALVGGKLYVFARQGDEEITLCVDAETGKEIWRDRYEAQAVTGAAGRHPGPRSSPAVADGKVVTLGVGGILSCLDAATGKVLWRKDPFPKVVPKFFTSMSPMIVNGMAVAHLGGPGEGALIAYGLASGEPKWKWSGEGPEYASPVLLTVEGTEQLVTLSEKSIVGIDMADGKLLWQLPFLPQRRAYNAATPIVHGQTVIFTGAGRGTKAVKIEKGEDGFVARELWSNPEVATQYNTPVLKGGFLYGISNNGNIFCLSAENGQTAWTDPTERDRSGFAAMVDAGSVILALPSNSELIVFEPTDEKYNELARIQIADTPTYAHPVISGKRIFVKDQDDLIMWTVE